MRKLIIPRQALIAWALTGLVVTCVLVAYQFVSDFKPFPLPLLIIFAILCPVSVLSIAFIDIEPSTAEFFSLWALIALLNSGVYPWIGIVIVRRRKAAASNR